MFHNSFVSTSSRMKDICWPNIWNVLFPTMFPASTLRSGPKHSTSVPFSAGVAVPLSVDEKKVAVDIPNPVLDIAVKALPLPQREEGVVLCTRTHWLLPLTLQVVSPAMSPRTVHLKVKASPIQVGGAALNCPVTSPGKVRHVTKLYLSLLLDLEYYYMHLSMLYPPKSSYGVGIWLIKTSIAPMVEQTQNPLKKDWRLLEFDKYS